MTRYYRVFDNRLPMKELTEQEAVARGWYIVEEHGPLHRYRRYSDGNLSSIIYDGVSSPEAAIADVRARRDGVPAEIFSPSRPTEDGGYRWREWHLDRDGNIEWISEPDYRSDGGHRRITTRAPDGALEHFTDYLYDADDNLTELIHHGPDGEITSREEPDHDGHGTITMREDVDLF